MTLGGSFRLGVLVAVSAFTALGTQAVLAGQRASDAEVKAAYLFNFARFVQWPAGLLAEGAPFNLCVLGRDPFGPVLEATLANETIDGHPVLAKRLDVVAALVGCHIVFLGSSEDRRWAVVHKALGTSPALTVSDMPRFCERGGMIEFVTVASRVRFLINLTAAASANLSPSGELARVALTVTRPVATRP